MAAAAPSAAVDEHIAKYRTLQEELNELTTLRQTHYQQANENGMVKQELELLEESAAVYKVVGPVLMKVDLGDAKDNVEKRLDFIKGAMEELETKIQGKQKESDELAEKIMQLQQELQARTAEAARAVAAQVGYKPPSS